MLPNRRPQGGVLHEKLLNFATAALKERGVTKILYESYVPSDEMYERGITLDILALKDTNTIGVDCFVQIQKATIEERMRNLPHVKLDQLIFCVPSEEEASKLKEYINTEVLIAGFHIIKTHFPLEDELYHKVVESKENFEEIMNKSLRNYLISGGGKE